MFFPLLCRLEPQAMEKLSAGSTYTSNLSMLHRQPLRRFFGGGPRVVRQGAPVMEDPFPTAVMLRTARHTTECDKRDVVLLAQSEIFEHILIPGERDPS
jgi:hypothetical protein